MTSRVLLLAFFASFFFLNVSAETDEGKFSLSSPYNTIYSHLYFLQDDSYKESYAARTLYAGEGVSKKDKIRLAKRLKWIFDGSGHRIEMDDIPNEADFTDSTGRSRYIVIASMPDIYLEKYGDRWLYSKKSVGKIDKLFKEIFPFYTHKLVEMLPHDSEKYFGLYLWQLIGILILLILSFILHKILVYVFEKILFGLMRRFGGAKIAHQIIVPVARPISYFVVFGILSLFIPVLQLPIEFAQYLIKIIRAALPFFIMMVFYKLVDVFCSYLEKLAETTESTLDDQLVPLLRKSLKVFVVVVGTIFILQNFDVDVTALLAGLSIGGLALAFAAQDTLKNFFGSIMIFVDRPFQIGDWIVSDSIDGSIEEVGFRSTRIRTFYNSVISVPNGNLADATIDNMGLREYRRFKTHLALTYDTPPELIEVFVEGLDKIVQDHPHTRKDNYHIYMNDMGAHSLDVLFYIFFKVPTWAEELKARQEIILSILKLADELGVRFAFPTQTLHVEEFPEKKSMTPDYGKIDKPSLRKKFIGINKKPE